MTGETDVLTQFGAALSELGIEHIRASRGEPSVHPRRRSEVEAKGSSTCC